MQGEKLPVTHSPRTPDSQVLVGRRLQKEQAFLSYGPNSALEGAGASHNLPQKLYTS